MNNDWRLCLTNLYILESSGDFSYFIEKYDNLENRFWNKYLNWQEVDLNIYIQVKYELHRSDLGNKNFKFDVSVSCAGLIILSEKAVNVFKDILVQKGQIIPINVDSKRKKFFGFYPNKNVYSLGIVDLEKSEYSDFLNGNGKSFKKLVLKNSYPKDDYLFTIRDVTQEIFLTEKFKNLVEENGLKAFAFKPFLNISE